MTLRELFTDHPRSVGETYDEHMLVALSFAGPLAKAAAAALVPFVCVKTASQTIKSLNDRMSRRCASCPKAALHRPDLLPVLTTKPSMAMSRLAEPDYVI